MPCCSLAPLVTSECVIARLVRALVAEQLQRFGEAGRPYCSCLRPPAQTVQAQPATPCTAKGGRGAQSSPRPEKGLFSSRALRSPRPRHGYGQQLPRRDRPSGPQGLLCLLFLCSCVDLFHMFRILLGFSILWKWWEMEPMARQISFSQKEILFMVHTGSALFFNKPSHSYRNSQYICIYAERFMIE